MSHTTVINGWERLPNGYDVQFVHNIPVRLSDNGKARTISKERLIEEVSALGELDIEIGDWHQGEKSDEREAQLFVTGEQLKNVLHRLALTSAALFFDRFKKPINKSAVDWDELEYRKDFGEALEHCALEWDDFKLNEYRDYYVNVMHEETNRLAQLTDPPFIEPE